MNLLFAAAVVLVLLLSGGKRGRVVQAALGELGQTDPTAYWEDTLGSAAGAPHDWCGAFALWALHRAGLAKDWRWEIGRGFLFRLPQTNDPKPGDVAYFDRNQHQAIVASVAPGAIGLVNGNGFAGAVTISTVRPQDVTAFFSIASLVGERVE